MGDSHKVNSTLKHPTARLPEVSYVSPCSSDTLLSTQRNERRGDANQEHVRSPLAETAALLPQCNSHCEYVYRDFPLDFSYATTPNPRRGGAARLTPFHSIRIHSSAVGPVSIVNIAVTTKTIHPRPFRIEWIVASCTQRVRHWPEAGRRRR
jgi:hypothetical protein